MEILIFLFCVFFITCVCLIYKTIVDPDNLDGFLRGIGVALTVSIMSALVDVAEEIYYEDEVEAEMREGTNENE